MEYQGICSIQEPNQARGLLLSGYAYVGFELPKYFSPCHFSKFLAEVESLLRAKGGLRGISDRPKESVNLKLYLNKDGKYSWRVLELQHPAIYSELVDAITEDENWKLVRRKLLRYRKAGGVISASSKIVIPCDTEASITQCGCEEKQQSRAEEEIKNRAMLTEKKSLSLAIKYNFMVHADIFDFYGQIYSHTIAWSLHGKKRAKKEVTRSLKKFEKSYLGGILDYWIRNMREGQSNGIPQGSALMDLIAELVLSYSDGLLSCRLKKLTGRNVSILRYRDDYRIFADGNATAELALKELSEVLRSLGLRLNDRKTQGFDDPVIGSLKTDKWDWLSVPRNYESPLHLLLAIYELVARHGAPGQALIGLKQLRKMLDNENYIEYIKRNRDDVDAFLGILVNIAYRFPRAIPQVVGAISSLVEDWPTKEIEALISNILEKFRKKPAHDFLEIWLQRLAKPHKISFECRTLLCKAVEGQEGPLWNSEWITNRDLKELIDSSNPVDEDEMVEIEESDASKRIPPDETELFYRGY